MRSGKSGSYVLRIAMGDMYVDSTYYLEEGNVYKIEYDVAAVGSAPAGIDNFAFSKISY